MTSANGYLDSVVFSDKEYKHVGPISNPFIVHKPVGRKSTHILLAKSKTWTSRCCGLSVVVVSVMLADPHR